MWLRLRLGFFRMKVEMTSVSRQTHLVSCVLAINVLTHIYKLELPLFYTVGCCPAYMYPLHVRICFHHRRVMSISHRVKVCNIVPTTTLTLAIANIMDVADTMLVAKVNHHVFVVDVIICFWFPLAQVGGSSIHVCLCVCLAWRGGPHSLSSAHRPQTWHIG